MEQDFSYDIFLSYNRAQKDWTRELARRLREDGFRVWFDEFIMDRQAGRNWINLIPQAIKHSRKVALVWSPEFFTHDWTKFEASILQLLDPTGDKCRILPILHTPCDLPESWAFLQFLDFTGHAYGTDEYEFRYCHLLYNLDNSRRYEGDFQRFQHQRQQQKSDGNQLPPVSPLPKGSRLPRAPIGNFVGREKELRELARQLTPGSLVGVHAAVTGMGGVGKTQLAIEFAHRFGRLYPGGVFWLNLEKAEDTITEVASCGSPLHMNLECFADRPVPEQAAFVRKAWEDGDAARLLIFDNAEEPELVEQWRPKYGRCSVLITSRRDYWPQEMNVQSMPIKNLSRPSSMELLEKARPTLLLDTEECQAANNLCEYLGDLPLALQVATAYLQRYQTERVQDYLSDLRQAADTDSGLQKVWSCFAVSYRKLKREERIDRLAMCLFQLAGYFAPTSIARYLLAEAADLDLADHKHRQQFNAAIARLQELALINQEPDERLLLHRLLWEFSCRQKSPLSRAETASHVGKILLGFAREENSAEISQNLLKERAHIWQAALEAERVETDLAAAIYNELGLHAKRLALMGEARSDYEKALQLSYDAHGSDHPIVATIANNIGTLLLDQGDLAGALEYIQRALQIDERVYGLDHPKVAIRANNIGAILRDQGDLTGALEYARRALQIDENTYGPDHPDVAAEFNNLGLMLRDQGDLTGALEYARRALQIDEKAYGPDHPNVARDANNLGTILRDQGDLVGALKYAQRALEIFETVYGPDHPKVAGGANNVGSILQDQGDLVGALEYTQRALMIDEKVYGADHPNVAIRANNMGTILQGRGEFVDALVYIRRALAIFEKVYGAEHPRTRTCADNLRYLQQLMNEKQEKCRSD